MNKNTIVENTKTPEVIEKRSMYYVNIHYYSQKVTIGHHYHHHL